MTSDWPSPKPGEDVFDFVRIQTETGWSKALAQFANWCSPRPGWRILDVGCGPGLLPAIFQQLDCQAFGVDLDLKLLSDGRLHTGLACADASRLPFSEGCFQLVTASNLLFLLADPLPVLKEMARLTFPDGRICVLNPSEHLSVASATEIANQRRLEGLARASLINWASQAESKTSWTANQTEKWFAAAGLRLNTTILKIGPGFARYACGIHQAQAS